MTEQRPVSTQPQPLRLTIDDFLLLERSGAFRDYARVELIDGEIWTVNATYSRHAGVQAEFQGRLWLALRERRSPFRVYDALSIRLPDGSLTQPDINVAIPNESGLMPASKVKLVVEISDTTLESDLGRKHGLYASNEIPEYWVVDVDGGEIHQFWSPADGRYRQSRKVRFGETLAASTIDGVTIDTDEL